MATPKPMPVPPAIKKSAEYQNESTQPVSNADLARAKAAAAKAKVAKAKAAPKKFIAPMAPHK